MCTWRKHDIPRNIFWSSSIEYPNLSKNICSLPLSTMVKNHLKDYVMLSTGQEYFEREGKHKVLGSLNKDKYWTKEFSKRVVTFNSTFKVKQFLETINSGYYEVQCHASIRIWNVFVDLDKRKKIKKKLVVKNIYKYQKR